MKQIFIMAASFFCLAFSTAFATEYQSYHSESSGFNIDVPAEFQYLQTESGMTQLTAGDQKTGVLMTVRVNQIRNGTTVAEQEEQLQAALPTLEQRLKSQGATMENSGIATIASHKAIYFYYTINRAGTDYYQEQYIVLGNNTMYSLVFTVPAAVENQYKPLFTHSISSMTIQ
ncbi:PsbP-related protein [Megasphaera paucivorans]|uniref:PsbP protein n=1 Tax=Megasphaera paucivorans TaxID=349095 RepID=A0A1G9QXQ0_9FIRM|nr:PsbP-related protein [Megasphaera paucivorans]SDM15812.1 PsbP protein [Megasphaera paucivorans]